MLTITGSKKFWNFKAYEESEWFKKLVKTLLWLALIYCLIHWITDCFFPKGGYEYVKLDKDQMQQVNRIYFDSPVTVLQKKPDESTSTVPIKESTLNTTQKTNVNINRDSLDSVKKIQIKKLSNDSIENTSLLKNNKNRDTCNCSSCTKVEKVMSYLWNEFNHKLDTSQLITIRQYLNSASAAQATNFLIGERFQVKSYFWLTGPLVYWEIIFWSWFGVICSILFNLGVVSKNSTTKPNDPSTYFDSSEIPSQIAKLLYAPACTLVIVLGYNFFNGQNLVDINSSKGVLVFAFIGGFYSSRLISFLDKLKDLLLPISSTDGKGGNTPSLRNIVVQLQLDNTVVSLWESLKSDLNSLKVTLQEEHSTQQAIALPIDTNQWPLFIFDFVKPGTYTIQALWSTKKDEKTISLKAEQKVEMKDTDKSVTLKLITGETVIEKDGQAIVDPTKKDVISKPTVIAQPIKEETPVKIDIDNKLKDNE